MRYNVAMPIPVIVTKLFIPPPRPNAVLRAALIARLNAGLHGRLTLISAPAGFGKTSLVASWLAERMQDAGRGMKTGQPDPASCILHPASFTWLSLDPADSNPARFLAHLVAALQTIAPTVGADVADLLQSAQPPPIEALLPLLLNQIVTLPPAILVLDDYHVLDARPIDQALAMLVEHLPPQLHLVITTREDPPLPLARLRARGQLTELRAADLRFSASEAAAFLNQVMGLRLSAEDIAALETRTEGWIAGLQLAALSLQGHQDVSGFIQAFAGDHRYIVDYLVDEVLRRQPEPVRRFLLQTSILDRLSGSLCDAILDARQKTPDEGSDAYVLRPASFVLEELEHGNFFVIPLDDQRRWYRYHHLFAEVLQAHLRAEQPELVVTLHRRASGWHEQHGALGDAIRHALAGEDFARAASLVERVWPAMSRGRQDAMLLGWLTALPNELLHDRPVLSVYYAHVLLARGELTGVENYLRNAERWLDKATASGEQSDARTAAMVVEDEAAFRRLPGAIAVARAGHALAQGDVVATVTYAQRVLDLVPEDDYLTRGGAAGFLGLAYWAGGDLEAAHRLYAEGMAHLQKAGNIADAINGAVTLAVIRIAQGRLREAMRTLEQGLQLATAYGAPLLRGTADMYVGMSEILRERGDLRAATQHLLHSKELGEHSGFPQNRYRWHVAMARVRGDEGDLDGTLNLLDEAARLYTSDFSPNVRPIAALKARVWIAQGRLGDALDWAREQGLSVEDELSYPREFEHITLARVLLAQATSRPTDYSAQEALGLLQRLLHAAEAGERAGSMLEILIVQALAHQMRGDIPAALLLLKRALALAEPEGYVRIFVDEGPAMAALIERMKDEGGRMKKYLHTLLSAFGKQDDVHPSSFIPHPLIEPLSERECDVLRLLRTSLDGPEIARQLMISLNTLRTHTKNIYAKLGVNGRQAAVRRAEELDLF